MSQHTLQNLNHGLIIFTGPHEQINAVKVFSRKDVTSLDYLYTKALLLD